MWTNLKKGRNGWHASEQREESAQEGTSSPGENTTKEKSRLTPTSAPYPATHGSTAVRWDNMNKQRQTQVVNLDADEENPWAKALAMTRSLETSCYIVQGDVVPCHLWAHFGTRRDERRGRQRISW